jgi:Polysaccharide lyase
MPLPRIRLLIFAATAVGLLLLVAAGIATARKPAVGLSEHRVVATSAPAPVAQPERAANSSSADNLLFSGTSVGDFLNQSAPGAISEIASPAGGSGNAFQMTVHDGDVYPITPTEDPRAELVSPPIAKNGTEFWATMKFFLPANFPSSIPGWMTVLEGPYGPPFEGPPPWHIEINGSHIQWVRNGTYGYDVPWSMPLIKNSWINVMVHEKFAGEGWVEMWINGQPIQFFTQSPYNPNHVVPTNKLEMQTMDASTNGGGGNSIHLMDYFEAGMAKSTTVTLGPLKVGTTREAVEG